VTSPADEAPVLRHLGGTFLASVSAPRPPDQARTEIEHFVPSLPVLGAVPAAPFFCPAASRLSLRSERWRHISRRSLQATPEF
jgi:hypothetical protein